MIPRLWDSAVIKTHISCSSVNLEVGLLNHKKVVVPQPSYEHRQLLSFLICFSDVAWSSALEKSVFWFKIHFNIWIEKVFAIVSTDLVKISQILCTWNSFWWLSRNPVFLPLATARRFCSGWSGDFTSRLKGRRDRVRVTGIGNALPKWRTFLQKKYLSSSSLGINIFFGCMRP